jgi:uncharacterized protein YgbK (DUF1537 family)
MLLCVADDLTGALEVGAKFAAFGFAAEVCTGWSGSAEVCVLDTETRHLAGDAALARLRQIYSAARARGDSLIYTKTDSTLRGNLVESVEAVRRVYPESPLMYAPAYPKMGRTVRQGVLYVNGVPVSKTAFGRDALNPVRESHIPTLLGRHCETVEAGQTPQDPKPALYLWDGETDEHVRAAAAFLGSLPLPHLAVGPAAFAEQIAACRGQPRPLRLPRVGSALLVNGSLHERSARQVEQAKSSGWADESWQILPALDRQRGCEEAVARWHGEQVRQALERREFGALIVFGGDTAFGILTALGQPALRPLGEVAPGTPVSLLRVPALDREIVFVTKAGGFGDDDILERIKRSLIGS